MTLLSDPSSPMNEAACVRLCAAFANHIDARRYERVLDLFTDDAVLDRMGHLVTGRVAISAFLEAVRAAERQQHAI